MKKVIIEYNENYSKKNLILEWLIYMIGYALVLITVSVIFKNTLYLDNSFFGVWGLLAAVIIYVLNKTVKPLLVLLTLPITTITLGIFYPFVNVIVLNIADFILGKHFDINGFFMAFIVALIISFMNIIMNNMIIIPLIERIKNE